ncbi:single-stranded-DNA-specific exonuclease RecJ [Candidatus Woesebacteria bacterium RIFCSPHIGHO2_01_FULL_41_10]|uniref:Single-stranded-DNA-specific exonuclease RecJ n=1 Tax=Candidatus Woesebacteria bacterium RIFCSPHIGHO2_01_FULL_41_10 TaxID=1802500 RepID=A0A1F7YS27_9BACT|nr:MAG: single-stranded-DNA-specific exonuclease RecJ [Candidatus Woesebacteria bacterium RIFCSPHIGHO2_01_FULL_41_10]
MNLFLKPPSPASLTINNIGILQKSLTKSLDLIYEAKKNDTGVLIYGDYDVDGICATAIMWEALHRFGIRAYPYIPNRFTDGYGLRAERAIKLATKQNAGLVITVDNGISSAKEVEKIKQAGLHVLITDHHREHEVSPSADSVFHTTEVCGAAIAWFLAREFDDNADISLAAIASITDQMKLVGPTRSIVTEGLDELNHSERPGILALRETINTDKRIGVYEIGYLIGPRINAAGRLEDGIEALRMLCTTDITRASALANKLNVINLQRQNMVDGAVKKAIGQVSKEKIIVIDDDYHEGIIGLIAGKLVEEFYRPAIVISTLSKQILKGSARSVEGFSILNAIAGQKVILENFGGHTMAAGFSLLTRNLDQFKEGIKEFADKYSKDIDSEPTMGVDMKLDFSQIKDELVEALSLFEPTGIGNPKPTFVIERLSLFDAKTVGKDMSHLKMRLGNSTSQLDAIGFGMGEYLPMIRNKKDLSCLATLEVNEWNGKKNIQLVVKDIAI